jgi:hypothetical protein
MKHVLKPVTLALVTALALAGCAGTPSPTATAPATAPPTGAATGNWQLDQAGMADRIKAASLTVLTAEGTAEHFHAHLDVIVNREPITVPAEIGVTLGADGKPNGISSVHTHDATGIIHIEAPVVGQRYTLGQALREWGVLGDRGCFGSVCNSSAAKWAVYVDGVKAAGDATDVALVAHEEIALVFGQAPDPIPSKYAFPEGL